MSKPPGFGPAGETCDYKDFKIILKPFESIENSGIMSQRLDFNDQKDGQCSLPILISASAKSCNLETAE